MKGLWLVLTLLVLSGQSKAANPFCTFLQQSSAKLQSVTLNTAVGDGVDVFIQLPIVIQFWNYTCGAATTAAVLQGFGFAVSEDDMRKEMHSNDEVGTLYTEIIKALRARGLLASTFSMGNIELLRSVVARGGVVIVAYQAYRYDPLPWPLRWQDGHYSAVIGVDNERVYLMDPSQDPGMFGYIPIYEFLQRWHDIDGTDAHGSPVIRFGIVVERGPQNSPLQRTAIPSNVNYTW